MKSYNASLQLSELSTIQVAPLMKPHRWAELRSRVGMLLKWGLAMLTDTSEIYVQERRDRQGHVYFVAFNRRTDRSFSSAAEQEIRIWIEQQYYT